MQKRPISQSRSACGGRVSRNRFSNAYSGLKQVLALFCLVLNLAVTAQVFPGKQDTLFEAYPFLDIRSNRIEDAHELNTFFRKLDRLVQQDNTQVNIVHIGDSHVQADYFPGTLRVLLQKSFGNAGRGFVFPYKMAYSNGARDLQVFSFGEWSYCRSASSIKNGNYGITGYGLQTLDSSAGFMMIVSNEDLNYEFNRLQIFTFDSPSAYDYVLAEQEMLGEYDEIRLENGHSKVFFSQVQDSFAFAFQKNHSAQFFGEFYGVSMENDQPGIRYHAIGQNGAFVHSTLKNTFFSEHLQALHPDLVIISLGTNDAYVKNNRLCRSCFKDHYRQLIRKVQLASPNASVLLTVPGDFYLKRKYHCSDVTVMAEVIGELASETGCAVWNLHRVMGGNYAMLKWQEHGLAQNDLIHFTEMGYRMQGYLLYEALLDAYQKRSQLR